MMTVLRPYQQDMLARLEKAWKKHRSVMVQMPTGTGKTVLLAEVIRNRKAEGVLVVAHRRELIAQIKQTIDSFDIDREKEHINVESIQRLSRAGAAPDYKPSLVIVDEAHHALAKTYKQLWEWWPKAKFLGLTATPCRLSGEAFTDLFDTLLQSWSIKEFIKEGWLSDLDYVSARPNSYFVQQVAGLHKRGSDGDYQTKEMALVMDKPESIQHLYDSYKTFADGKKGIVYAINREHARHIAAYYRQQGISCAMIDAQTPEKEREQTVERYRQQQIDVLVNVDIFGEGFDCPEVEFIQLARPTLSLNKYLQQVGRGMRVSEGKSEVTILDQVGLYLSFGLPTSDRNWSAMFNGRMAGKGKLQALTSPVEKKGTADMKEKILVNEQMIRLKLDVTAETAKEEEEDEDEKLWRYPVLQGRTKDDALWIVLHWALWCNDQLIILRENRLVLRNDPKNIMEVYGYYKNSVLVKTNKVIGYQQIMSDGSMGQYFEYAPSGVTVVPDTKLLSLRKPEKPTERFGIGMRIALSIYEQEIQERLQRAWQRLNKVLIILTSEEEALHLMTESIRLEQAKNLDRKKETSRILLIAREESYVSFFSNRLARHYIKHRVFKDYRLDEMTKTTVAISNADALSKNLRSIPADYQPTLIIIADADLAAGVTYERLWKRWPESRYLGLTTQTHNLRKDAPTGMFDLLLQSWDCWSVRDRELPDTVYHKPSRQILSVFKKDSRLGIKKDNKVMTEAKFLRIDMLDDPDYFAIGTYTNNGGEKCRTIIDKNGIDLKAEMMGQVEEMGNGIFGYRYRKPGQSLNYYWDAIGNQEYHILPPETVKIGGICFVKRERGYKLRFLTIKYEDVLFHKQDVYYNDAITIVKDILVVNSKPCQPYMVYGYKDDAIIVYAIKKKGYHRVELDGTVSEQMTSLEPGTIEQPFVGELFLGEK